MSRTVVLTSCVKTKQTDGEAHAAADLYTSPLFKGMRQYAEREGHAWLILSAAHGLVDPEQELEAYDITLSTMNKAQRQAWSAMVLEQLAAKLQPGDRVILLAGMAYREFLVGPLRAAGKLVHIPMEGLQLGEQKAWLNRANAAPTPAVEEKEVGEGEVSAAAYTPLFSRYAHPGQLELDLNLPKVDRRMHVALGRGWFGHREATWSRMASWSHPMLPGVIRHCMHPTAHRPYYIEDVPALHGRTFKNLASAQAAVITRPQHRA